MVNDLNPPQTKKVERVKNVLQVFTGEGWVGIITYELDKMKTDRNHE